MPLQIWILALGRLCLQIGSGFVLFYTTIFFVNEIGLPAAFVGLAVGCQSIAGIGGRFLGGIFCDSQYWGRRGTLLLSAAISVLGDAGLAIANNLPLLILANLLLGLGIGLYWPAIETILADLTADNKRHESYAIAAIADTIGLAIGTFCGGQIIAVWGNYRLLFLLQGFAFLIFFTIISLAISEPDRPISPASNWWRDWLKIGRDRAFIFYVFVNTFFIFYISQIYTTLSLYLTNFIVSSETETHLDIETISFFITYYISLTAICQLPIARLLERRNRVRGLIGAMLLWGGGFLALFAFGTTLQGTLFLFSVAMTLFALGTVAHGLSSFAFVAEIAPKFLRGTYFSWSNQSWGIGFSIGPIIGGGVMGLALQRDTAIAHWYWLAIATTAAIGIGILLCIEGLVKRRSNR